MSKTNTVVNDINNLVQFNDLKDVTIDRAIRNLQPTDEANRNDKTIQRQRLVIGVLKNERNELLNNLKVCRSKFHEDNNNKTIDEISELLNEVSSLDHDIQTEKSYLTDLNTQIRKTQYAVFTERKKERKIHVGGSNTKGNLLEGLQDRLHMHKVKLNEIMKENQKYREEIEVHLKSRGKFNDKYNELLKHLSLGKKVVEDLLEQSETLYDDREKIIVKLGRLREKNINVLRIQREEMIDLVQKRTMERLNKNFFFCKNIDRSDMMNKKTNSNDTVPERLITEQHISESRKIIDEIANFNTENFGDIDTAMNYNRTEKNIFQLLLYNNELNDELEVLKQDLESKMVLYLEKKDDMMDLQSYKLNKLATFNKAVSEVQGKIKMLENFVKHHFKPEMTKLLSGIENLFSIADCNNGPLLLLLGDNSFITEHNCVMYLQIIEEKISEILNTTLFPPKDLSIHPPSPPVDTSSLPNTELVSQVLVASPPCFSCLFHKAQVFYLE